MCRKACSEFEGVCGHKSVPVGMKVCQWAQRRVSGHKGVSVGKNPRQRAQRRVNGQKGV